MNRIEKRMYVQNTKNDGFTPPHNSNNHRTPREFLDLYYRSSFFVTITDSHKKNLFNKLLNTFFHLLWFGCHYHHHRRHPKR